MAAATELKNGLAQLVQEGEALERGLLIKSGVPREDFLEQAKDALRRSDARARAEGRPKPKGTLASRAERVMETWVLGFRRNYETWYSEASAVVSQVLPDRSSDFRHLYRPDRRKELDVEAYGLADYQLGLRVTRGPDEELVFDPDHIATSRFGQQLNILRAAQKAFDSRLVDIRGVVQADLFDSEVDAAKELLKNGYVRPAGVVGGVVLERHLAAVARFHGVAIRGKSPTLSHYNDALKDAGILDVPLWRSVQRLADIRNLCAHSGGREPTAEEVEELLDGVAKLSKTVG